jgi:hypothetical protein
MEMKIIPTKEKRITKGKGHRSCFGAVERWKIEIWIRNCG